MGISYINNDIILDVDSLQVTVRDFTPPAHIISLGAG